MGSMCFGSPSSKPLVCDRQGILGNPLFGLPPYPLFSSSGHPEVDALHPLSCDVAESGFPIITAMHVENSDVDDSLPVGSS